MVTLERKLYSSQLVKWQHVRFWSGRSEIEISSWSNHTTARHHCYISLKGDVLPTGAMVRKWALQTCYTLHHNAASLVKDLIWKESLS